MSDAETLPAFLSLSTEDQRDAYLVGAVELGRSTTVLEKDVWVCWTLDALFRCPGMPDMAFKGGTSLSKIFNAIARFSEDIDVTMDHKGLAPELDPYAAEVSRKQQARDAEELGKLMCKRSSETVVPHLRACLEDLGLSGDLLEIVNDGEEIHVRYPHAINESDSYYREAVKIEFGGRNMIEPNATHPVVPYMAEAFDNLAFPSGQVQVLSPMRTFWEKVTLAHADSRRPEFKSAERTSRHWYDIAVLSKHSIGRDALEDIDLLKDVIRVKNRFYHAGYAQYELCLEGKASLLPDAAGQKLLEADYRKMIEAGMLEEPLDFDEMIARVKSVEDAVNATVN